ncbi:hypothetical protein [Hymenobacter volaticus]|uniref:Lipocalin-like domain-containing protein n=1 Tax=Hymenobacter volaticus TaxID=2932254 RepID=A0ABY4GBV5_9BACT|nr:hypothetical protein [Hymenobacter volaticus]UOQ68376.1 hypothetical protein MUN86_11295 [Hymenobacter volaticus]
MRTTPMNLTGHWQKSTDSTCSTKYPATIEFKPNGLYMAQGDAQAQVQPVWDVGNFTVNQDTVQISTYTDAVVAYKASLDADTLTLQDPEGCTVAYQRL